MPFHRAAIRDARLSWGARGLFGFLWDLPRGWRPNVVHLVSMGLEGRDAVRARLAELEAVGALRREPLQLPTGKFSGTRWVVVSPSIWAREAPLRGGEG